MVQSSDETQPLIYELEKVNLHFPAEHSYQKIIEDLSEYINRLIDTDFSMLLSLLYRLDISEEKLRNSLDVGTGETAGTTIATMIVERQLEKIESRKLFKAKDDISEDEKW